MGRKPVDAAESPGLANQLVLPFAARALLLEWPSVPLDEQRVLRSAFSLTLFQRGGGKVVGVLEKMDKLFSL
jgi:hypothetical protein